MLKSTYDKTHRRNAPSHLYLPTITIMKSILISATLIIIAHLYLGYYVSLDFEDPRLEIFIKKHPTLQVRFENIYTSEEEPKPLKDLSTAELIMLRNYCKFRLGIDNPLRSQDDLEVCKAR